MVGLQVKRAGLDLEARNAGEELRQLLDTIDLRLAPGEEGQETRAFLDGEDVSAAIRTPEMAMKQPFIRFSFLIHTNAALAQLCYN